jgi:protein-tyrosine phosphatase
VLEGLKKGENVIVHCGRGISRSATVVIAALMVKDGLCYRDACAV